MVQELTLLSKEVRFPDSAPAAYPVFFRTYSRKYNNKRESWAEVCDRTLSGLKTLGKLTQSQVDLIDKMQKQLKSLTSGRWLWVGGTEWVDRPENFSGSYNCTSTNVIDWRSFGLMMDLAMQGSGTGGVLEPQYISQLPVIRNQLQVNVVGAIGATPVSDRRHNTDVEFDYTNNAVKFFVGDSRQGWVKSYQSLLELCSDEQFDASKPVQVTVDISDVRPSGEALKGFGGMANPVKLPTLYDRCANILNKAIGRQLTSVECCILIDEAAVCIVAGNIRRCLPENALVHTSKGLVAIKDVQVGDLVQTPLGFRPVLNKFDQGMQEVQEIETNATFPRATIKHRVAVLSDAKGSIRWKYVAALDVGDRLMHSTQILSGTVTHLPEDDTEQRPVNSRNAKSLTIPVLTPEVAWLIGFTHGDGYVALGRNKHDKPYGRVEWAMNATQPELCQKLQAKLDQVLAMFGLTATHGVVKGENTAKTVCTSIRLAEYFHKHIKQPNTVLEVPSFILQGSTDIRSAYLAGLMDSDGAVDNRPPHLVTSVYRQFVRQVSVVLSSLGIAGRISITTPKELNWQAKYNLTIPALKERYNALIAQHSVKGEIRQGLKMYGFTIAGEMMREVYTYSEMRDMGFQGSRSVNSNYERYIAESDVSMDIPVSVKGLGSQDYVQTYDIEVEEAHCFYCDGYLTHNSAGMRQFSSEDTLGSVAKDNLWQQDEAGNWRIDPERDALRMANHTRVFHRKPTEQECVDAVRKQYYSGEGAIQWAGEAIARSNADLITTPELKRDFLAAYVKGAGKEWLRSQQPEVSEHELEHRLQRYALNPCLTADTWVHTEHGARQISDLIGQQVGVYVNGELFSTTADGFFLTGNKSVVSLQTKEGFGLRLTENHQLLKVTAQTQHAQYTEWVETKDLKIGDRILLHDHREIQSWEGEGSFEEGWLVGNLLGDGSLYQTQWNDAACLRYWGETKEEMASYAIKTLEYATNYESQNSTGHYHKQLHHQVINSSGLATLAAKFGLSPQNKVMSSAIEKASYAFYCGFLRGFFDADGSVQGKQEKGVSVRLAQSNLETLQAVQRMLARVGIISSVYQQRRPAGVRMLPNSDRELAPYMCKEQHELVIANDNLQHFATNIGFQDPLKAARLQESLGNYSRKMNRERFTATITGITADGVEPVYDCTVPQVSRFDANGIVAHNCGEILGADFHCNLSEVHLNLINPKDEKEQEAAFKAGALSVASLLNHQFIEKRYQFSREVDPIVGVSFTGLFDFFVHAFGVEWLRWWEAGRPDTVQGLDFKEKEANYLNRWREIVHQTVWEYCDAHGLRRPNRCTTTQPAGCLDRTALRIFDQGLLYADEIVEAGSGESKGLDLSVRNGIATDTAIANQPLNLVRVTLENGRVLRMTPNHRLAIANQWVRADRLELGMDIDYSLGEYRHTEDALLLSLNPAQYTREGRKELLGHGRGVLTAEITTPITLNPELGYFLGCLFGDGAMSESKDRVRFAFNEKELDLVERLQAIAQSQFGLTGKISHDPRNGGTRGELTFASGQLFDWLKLNQLQKGSSKDLERIPLAIRKSSRETILAFFCGLIDTDGCVREKGSLSIDSSSEAFIRNLQQVGEAVGLCFGIFHNTQGENFQGQKDMWGLSLSRMLSQPESLAYLNTHSRKCQLRPLPEPKRQFAFHPYRVTSIEFETTPDYSYDFAVSGIDDDDSWYWQGALKSHNTKSLLTGASPGWHPPKAQRFIRRITFRKDDPVARACMDYGYSIIPSQSDKDENGQLLNDPFDPRCTEWLVEIPVSVSWADLDGADKVDISKFDVMAQFDFYMQVQKHYTRHNTSATLELREAEIEPLGKKIYEAIRDDEGYISAALLARFDDLQTFPRLPFEPIDKATYEKLSAEVLERRKSDDFYASLLRYDSGELMDAGPAGCDSDKCMFPEQKP